MLKIFDYFNYIIIGAIVGILIDPALETVTVWGGDKEVYEVD